jgi:RNA polymerase-binding transcription factor
MATNNRLIEEIANQLRRRRLSLLEDIAGSQRGVRALLEERGSEIEENAQKDRITSLASHLNSRDEKMIRQINATLKRIDEGTYGQCDWCEDEIGWERIRALPTTTLCIDCATAREKRQRAISINRSSEWLMPFTASLGPS